jgi:hypothetical protein
VSVVGAGFSWFSSPRLLMGAAFLAALKWCRTVTVGGSLDGFEGWLQDFRMLGNHRAHAAPFQTRQRDQ